MYNIYDGQGHVVETAASQLEAFDVIDWLTVTDHKSGPFHCAPVLVPA